MNLSIETKFSFFLCQIFRRYNRQTGLTLDYSLSVSKKIIDIPVFSRIDFRLLQSNISKKNFFLRNNKKKRENLGLKPFKKSQLTL